MGTNAWVETGETAGPIDTDRPHNEVHSPMGRRSFQPKELQAIHQFEDILNLAHFINAKPKKYPSANYK
jgi:hypothetical protein